MSLLDFLTELIPCQFISDLHFININDETASEILAIPERRFPLADYPEALTYLTGFPHDDQDMTITEFKEALVRELKKH